MSIYIYLGVILKAIEFGGGILDGSDCALLTPCHDIETRRESNSFITMTHPNKLTMSNFLNRKKSRCVFDLNFHTAILLRVTDADFTAKTADKKLKTVADTENRDGIGLSPLKKAVGEGRGIGSVNGVGTTGENDEGGVEFSDGLKRRSAVEAERENGEASDTASDEVSVLGTEVEDEN